LFAGLAACSSASPDGAEQHADPPPPSENQIEKTPDIAPETPQAKPVTLTMSTHFPIDEEFNRLYVEPLKKAYPNINLRLLQGNNLTVIDQYLVAGQVPDLYLTYNGNLPGFFDRGLAYDMTDLMKTYNVDLGRFHQNYVDDIRFAVDGQEGLYGLPISTTFHALYYNKDIFDEFGAAYPKPGLTWDDMHALAQSLTRLENGMQYRGYDFYNITRLAQPLGLEYVDRQTEKAIVNTDQ